MFGIKQISESGNGKIEGLQNAKISDISLFIDDGLTPIGALQPIDDGFAPVKISVTVTGRKDNVYKLKMSPDYWDVLADAKVISGNITVNNERPNITLTANSGVFEMTYYAKTEGTYRAPGTDGELNAFMLGPLEGSECVFGGNEVELKYSVSGGSNGAFSVGCSRESDYITWS